MNSKQLKLLDKLNELVLKCTDCDLCNNGRCGFYFTSKSKYVIIGEAPGCVSGDTLIEVAYRNKFIYPKGIPIKDLIGKKNFYVYSIDVNTRKITLGKVNKVWKSGTKKTYQVTYEWFGFSDGKNRQRYVDSIIVTANHPFLLRKQKRGWNDPFKGIEEDKTYLSIEQGLRPGHSLQPFNHIIFQDRGYIRTAGMRSGINEARFLTEFKIDRKVKLNHEENCHHVDGNSLNDCWENLECLSVGEHARLHISANNPMSNLKYRRNHKKAITSKEYRDNLSNIMKKWLSNPENKKKRLQAIEESNQSRSNTIRQRHRTDPQYRFNYLKGRQKIFGWSDKDVICKFKKTFPDCDVPNDNHKIISIEELGYEEVYDMEVEDYHNFAAQGIFIHNSEEDRKGTQLIGKAGTILWDNAREYGLSKEEFGIINTVQCRPVVGNRNGKPQVHQQQQCRKWVRKFMKIMNPDYVLLLGRYSIAYVTRMDMSVLKMNGTFGYNTFDDGVKRTYLLSIHPSYCQYNKNGIELLRKSLSTFKTIASE